MPAPRGRQREARRNDDAILDAARVVFGRDGFDAPISAVAAQAGVGAGSLYRRYASKQALLAHLCLISVEQNLDTAERALACDDAGAGLRWYVEQCVEFSAGMLSPLAGTIDVGPELATTSRRAMQAVAKLVRRAHDQGVLRTDISEGDLLVLIETLSRGRVREPHLSDRAVAIALDGLRPGGRPLPGRPMSPMAYRRRWTRPR
jgi:AcrR family transcriptional regulator